MEELQDMLKDLNDLRVDPNTSAADLERVEALRKEVNTRIAEQNISANNTVGHVDNSDVLHSDQHLRPNSEHSVYAEGLDTEIKHAAEEMKASFCKAVDSIAGEAKDGQKAGKIAKLISEFVQGIKDVFRDEKIDTYIKAADGLEKEDNDSIFTSAMRGWEKKEDFWSRNPWGDSFDSFYRQ